MTNKALSIFNQLRPLSVGFDDMFDHFESMFDVPTVNYPPYNLCLLYTSDAADE